MPAEDHRGIGVCPACTGRLYPRELACADCGLHVSTRYADNEFQNLDADSLHLLRVFIACEGRIRDMERALGVSYPTVKSRLAALRSSVGLGDLPERAPSPERARSPKRAASGEGGAAPQLAEVLDRMEAGEIDFDEAMRQLKAR